MEVPIQRSPKVNRDMQMVYWPLLQVDFIARLKMPYNYTGPVTSHWMHKQVSSPLYTMKICYRWIAVTIYTICGIAVIRDQVVLAFGTLITSFKIQWVLDRYQKDIYIGRL